ncbi:hypothetical protein RFI_16974, partial [Reticulomyxa filosa]
MLSLPQTATKQINYFKHLYLQSKELLKMATYVYLAIICQSKSLELIATCYHSKDGLIQKYFNDSIDQIVYDIQLCGNGDLSDAKKDYLEIVVTDYCNTQILQSVIFIFHFKVFLSSAFPFINKHFFIWHHQRLSHKNKLKFVNEKEEIQIILHYWIQTLNIKLGWTKDFDKLVVNY